MERVDNVVAVHAPSERKTASRQKLLKAARKLFLEKGYHVTRPQDISREAGVGHGTFYLHFNDKRDCFWSFLEEAADELRDIITSQLSDRFSVGELVRTVLVATLGYEQDNPGVIAMMMTDPAVIDGPVATRPVVFYTRAEERWISILRNFQARGLMSADISPEVVGPVLGGIIYRAMDNSRRRGIAVDDMVRNLTRFLERGLGAVSDS